MNPANPPDAAEVEWALQERAREEKGLESAVGPTVRLNRYRLIARVLREPLGDGLPRGLTETILAAASATARRSAVASNLGVILTTIGGAYVAAMALAAFLTRTDLGRAVAALDRPIVLIAVAVALSQAAVRAFAVFRLARSPLRARG